MRVLVTGGAGFIGRWVAKKFLQNQHSIYVIDNLSNGQERNLAEFRSELSEFIQGDIRDGELVSRVFSECKLDVCVHLAAQVNVQHSIDNSYETFDVNINGTRNLLDEARKHQTAFVQVSTCFVYDTAYTSRAIDESHPLNPRSPYAASKLAADFMAIGYHHTYGLPVTVIRPFNVYGPFQRGDAEGGVVSVFIQKVLNNLSLEVYGDGTQTRDLMYVEDCAESIFRASVSNNLHGEVFNVGTGCDITINDLAMLIAGDEGDVRHVKHIHPQSEVQKFLCNPSKAERTFKWRATIPLEAGVERTKLWLSSLQRDGRR